jgi:predicted 2-oxoglutarate/Fe(II)-dependent dioxygenase YbiX
MNIKEPVPGVFMIENYISQDSCDFLIDVFSKDLHDTPIPNMFAGITGYDIDKVEYKEDIKFNIAIDFNKSIIISIKNLLSNKFNFNYKLKTYFFNCLTEGAKMGIHIDNDALVSDDIEENQYRYKNNLSALLYLNDNYMGGELHFMNENISISPKPGSLIFFQGDADKPHKVKEVVSGNRYNIVSFYEPAEEYKN